MKPYSESCDQNRDAILEIIKPLFKNLKGVLEVGSGTGQHAIYFAKEMPHLIWHSSDQAEYHDGIKQWLADAKLDNTPAPIELNVSTNDWPKLDVEAIFSANSVHIMTWENVIDFINNAGKLLETNGLLVLYGPFNYDNDYTSKSNAIFDVWLKERDPDSGIRDFEAVDKLAQQVGLTLKEEYEMPANNRILCWQKS